MLLGPPGKWLQERALNMVGPEGSLINCKDRYSADLNGARLEGHGFESRRWLGALSPSNIHLIVTRIVIGP